MIYIDTYESPIGRLLLLCSDEALMGCGFTDSENYQKWLTHDLVKEMKLTWFEDESVPTEEDAIVKAFTESEECGRSHPILDQTRAWLDAYFDGTAPEELPDKPPMHVTGQAFRRNTLRFIEEVPYGETITYGKISLTLAGHLGLGKVSSQAVGGAAAHNPIPILIPCHRVVGYDGSLVGYSGGLFRKVYLLELEGVDTSTLKMPE